MIKLTTMLVMVGLCVTNCAYGHNEWVAIQTIPQNVYAPPIIEVPLVPAATFSTYTRPLPIAYGWVPYTITEPILIERHGLICKYRTIVYNTRIEWVYQPIWK